MKPKGRNRATGISGEMAARAYLEETGHSIREQNYRTAVGEIDIIAEKNREIIFIEVKSRYSKKYGLPQEAVGRVKQRKILKTAMWYIQANRLHDRDMRFDVLTITFDQKGDFTINHIPRAFDATEWRS